tara:strand:- start:1867 stop:3285 length:1419 start_codon:yes stop_codon:yes gene_type:complete
VVLRLGKLRLNKHSIFGDIEVNLSSESSSSNYRTIILGPNGTGKSSFLGGIADILSIEFSKDKKKSLKSYKEDYDLEIVIDSEKYNIKPDFEKVDLNIDKVIAVTSTMQDRFPFIAKNSVRRSDKYVYLGMKTTSNNMFFSNLKENILLSLFPIYYDNKKTKAAISVLNKLGFGDKFNFQINKGRNYSKVLKALINNETISYNDNYDAKNLKDFIESDYAQRNRIKISNLFDGINEKDKGYLINVKLDNRNRFDDKVAYLELIKKLLSNNVISIGDLSLFSTSGYDMNQASSGEFNVLRTFLSVIANVSDNTVVLIDEPEVSLHPNWQMEFISILDLALSHYTGCHSIIATHSHFILSNVSNEDSTIISLLPSSESRNVYVSDLNLELYGWSPENVLYRAFGVTGYRNKYFEIDLRIIIDFLSEPKADHTEFLEAVDRVEPFKLEKNDPLYKIIENARNKRDEILLGLSVND